MAQITNALTIRQLEQIAYGANPHHDARSWTSRGLECRRDRHRYTGQYYSFTTEILQLCCGEQAPAHWEALIVNERWATGTPEVVFRHAKWMKLVSGNASALRAWLLRNRLPDIRVPATVQPEASHS